MSFGDDIGRGIAAGIMGIALMGFIAGAIAMPALWWAYTIVAAHLHMSWTW